MGKPNKCGAGAKSGHRVSGQPGAPDSFWEGQKMRRKSPLGTQATRAAPVRQGARRASRQVSTWSPESRPWSLAAGPIDLLKVFRSARSFGWRPRMAAGSRSGAAPTPSRAGETGGLIVLGARKYWRQRDEWAVRRLRLAAGDWLLAAGSRQPTASVSRAPSKFQFSTSISCRPAAAQPTT